MQSVLVSFPFLTSRGVSPLLAASLIRAAIDEVLQTDLTEFKQQSVETEGGGDEEMFTCKYTLPSVVFLEAVFWKTSLF